MNWLARAHFLHRAWRYRLRSEKFGIAFLMSRQLRGRTVVDIGANRGIYSYWMSTLVGREGRIIAFEPQPELARQLQGLRRAFGIPNLEIEQVGLSADEETMILRRPKHHWGGASLQGHPLDPSQFDLISVTVTTLDSYRDKHPGGPIAFIKCDVEGHEEEVFRGAREVLTNDRPDLLFECHRAADPRCGVFTLLRSLGYEGFCFHRGHLAPVSQYAALRPTMDKKALMDFVFIPAERVRQEGLSASTLATTGTAHRSGAGLPTIVRRLVRPPRRPATSPSPRSTATTAS